MLSRRLIGTVLTKENHVVQSIGFKRHLPLGKPNVTVGFLDQWGIDEIFLLDIDRSDWNSAEKLRVIRECSESCFVPLTVGGESSLSKMFGSPSKTGQTKSPFALKHKRIPNSYRWFPKSTATKPLSYRWTSKGKEMNLWSA